MEKRGKWRGERKVFDVKEGKEGDFCTFAEDLSTEQVMMDEQSHYSNHGAVRREVKPNGHRRAFAHDYREVGTYMVTIVTEGRARVFGHIEGSALATKRLERAAWVHDKEAPHIVLSELGRRLLEEEVPKINRFYSQVEVWRVAMMPDHIHLLLRVKEALPEGKHLGQVIRGFKTGCTRVWWALENERKRQAGGEAMLQPSGNAPGTVAAQGVMGSANMQVKGKGEDGCQRACVPEAFPSGCQQLGANNQRLEASNQQMAANNQRWGQTDNQGMEAGQVRRPLLFSAGYHDRIVKRPGMLENIKRYMLENPLRARIKEECPRLMQRQLHLWIDGQEYAAFGNLFLLKFPQKEQVFFHRYTEVDEAERKAILSSLQESTKTQLHTSKGEGNQPSEGKGIWLKGLYLTDKERQHLEKDPLKMPTHLTAAYSQEHARLLRMAEEGTVLTIPSGLFQVNSCMK